MKENWRTSVGKLQSLIFLLKSREQTEIQIYLASYPRSVITFLMVCLGHIILVDKTQ